MDINKEVAQKERGIDIFLCYAHEDEDLCKHLKKHLRSLSRQGLIHIWHDRQISAGKEWKQEIDAHLSAAHIILLLVSPDFMDSDYCYGIEMERAMQQHQRGETWVIPIILRPVHFQDAPFGKLQVLPTDAVPVTSKKWHNLDEAFYDIVEGIRQAAKVLAEKPSMKIKEKVSSLEDLPLRKVPQSSPLVNQRTPNTASHSYVSSSPMSHIESLPPDLGIPRGPSRYSQADLASPLLEGHHRPNDPFQTPMLASISDPSLHRYSWAYGIIVGIITGFLSLFYYGYGISDLILLVILVIPLSAGFVIMKIVRIQVTRCLPGAMGGMTSSFLVHIYYSFSNTSILGNMPSSIRFNNILLSIVVGGFLSLFGTCFTTELNVPHQDTQASVTHTSSFMQKLSMIYFIPLVFAGFTGSFIPPLILTGRAFIPPAFGVLSLSIIIILTLFQGILAFLLRASIQRLVLITLNGFVHLLLISCWTIFGPSLGIISLTAFPVLLILFTRQGKSIHEP